MRFGAVSSPRRADTGHSISGTGSVGGSLHPGQHRASLLVSVRLGFLTHLQDVINCDLRLPLQPVLWAAVSRGPALARESCS